MKTLNKDEIRTSVRESYAKTAKGEPGCCGPGCCGGEDAQARSDETSVSLGYSQADVSSVPEGANMGLGCGNPQAIAALKPGEVVVDLGSGGGFDCFLASNAVGHKGTVIGIDMTPEMVAKARENAREAGIENVEFRLGEIENLPVQDGIADVLISNCVINLSPEKPKVMQEAFRVLKSGGRIAVTDIVATSELSEEVRGDLELYAGCISGAALISEVKTMLERAGFVDIKIETNGGSLVSEHSNIFSANIEAVKP